MTGVQTCALPIYVYDVSPSNIGDDLGANPLQEEGNDEAKDPVIVHVDPATRTRAKRL